MNASSLLLWYGKVCVYYNISFSSNSILTVNPASESSTSRLFTSKMETLISFGVIGPHTKVMRKAKMSFQSGQVKQVIRTYAVEIQTGDKKDLDAEAVTLKLRKAMGANCKFQDYVSSLCYCRIGAKRN